MEYLIINEGAFKENTSDEFDGVSLIFNEEDNMVLEVYLNESWNSPDGFDFFPFDKGIYDALIKNHDLNIDDELINKGKFLNIGFEDGSLILLAPNDYTEYLIFRNLFPFNFIQDNFYCVIFMDYINIVTTTESKGKGWGFV